MMTQEKLNFLRSFGILIFISFLSGCSSLELENGTWAEVEEEPGSSTDSTVAIKDESGQIEQIEQLPTGFLRGQEYEQSAADKSSPEKEELLLYGVSSYLDEGNLNKADQLLNLTRQTQLPEQLYLRQQVLSAALHIKHNEPEKAAQLIENLNQYESQDDVFQGWLQLVQAQLGIDESDFLASLKQLNQQTSDQSNPVTASQNQALWLLIKKQSIETLESTRLDTSDQALLGWIELGIIDKKRGRISVPLWQQSVNLWARSYPGHPASPLHQQMTSQPLVSLDQTGFASVNRIALLLPLSSPYADIAMAIRDGFLAAGNAQGANIRIYDTGIDVSQIPQLYQQALLSGAQIIVGPLGKAAATQLALSNEIVKPTLLLGSIADSDQLGAYSFNTFMYSLDPEHEANSLAKQVYKRGYNRIGILYPDSSRGKRLNSAFAQSWRSLGGQVTSSIVYSNDLYQANEPVERLFSSSNTIPDAIFLASNSQQGRLLSQVITKQLPDIAIFATSSIYSGQPEATRDFVMNNVIFSDMPWMIEGFTDVQFMKQQLLTDTQTTSDSLSRYFAFGIDAYMLASRLPQFIDQPGAFIKGVTGNIQLDGDAFTLTRPLIQFVEGTPVPFN